MPTIQLDVPHPYRPAVTHAGGQVNLQEFGRDVDRALRNLTAAINALTTTNIAEGTNLYYTDARARAAITANSPIVISAGVISFDDSVPFVVNNYIGAERYLCAVALVVVDENIAFAFNAEQFQDLELDNSFGTYNFSTDGREEGHTLIIRILNSSGGPLVLSFAAWTFVGGVAPVALADGATALLTLRCFGPDEEDVIAKYDVTP